MCQVLEVGRSTFYDWLNHSQSERRAEDEILKEKILEIFLKSDRTYGHRRIKKRLRRQHIKCSNSRIRRLMKELRLVPVQTRKFKATTNSKHSLPVAPNLLHKISQLKPHMKNGLVISLTFLLEKAGSI